MPEPTDVTILVVDDDEVKRYTVVRILRKAGFAVQEARTGAEALAPRAERPDLIVLDVNLPDIDGFEVCRRIKADLATAAVPVLHLSTAFVQSEDRAHGLESGADGYLTEAVEPQELIATVRSLLRIRRAEEAARRSALQWQATFNAISDGVALLDRDGRIVRANRALVAILGRSGVGVGVGGEGEGEGEGAIAIEGRSLHDLLPLGPEDPGTCPFALMRETGRREEVDLTFRGRGLLITADPFLNEGGALAGAVCIVSDVTRRRQDETALRESEERFRLLVAGVKDYAIFMMDAQGLVVSWNEGAQRILGYNESEIVGTPIACIFTPEDRAARVPAHELLTAFSEGRAEDVRWHLRKDGTRFWASGVVSPLLDDDGNLRGFAKVMRDATEPKRMEEELRRRADELADADRRKDEFLAMLAHELRNPLAPIRNALEVIRLSDADTPGVDRACEMADRQVGHMARLIDDLLDVSRITRGKIQLREEPVDLSSAIADAVETTRPLLDSLGHRLTVSTPPGPIRLIGDSTRLEQVLANLLNNAAKYTEPGGRIELSAEAQGEEVAIRVRDDGVGIAPEMLPRVFDLFAQADRSLARAQGGLGIGLTLVRSLVEMHGGRVSARSEGLGLGSEFLVRLPVSHANGDPTRPEPAPRKAPGASPRSLSVLVVDDHRDSATSLAKVLGLWGHQTRVVHDGLAGIEAVDAHEPDVVLLDIGLPGIDGYRVAERLRQPGRARVPVLVALTGYGQEEDRRKALAVGFDHHLVKPVNLDELQRLLASLRLPDAGQARPAREP